LGIRPDQEDSFDLGTSVAHPARVFDYRLGDTENSAAGPGGGAITAFPASWTGREPAPGS
jgi:hypothetical protein